MKTGRFTNYKCLTFPDEKPKPPTTDPVPSQDGQTADEDHNSWRRSTRNNQLDKSEFQLYYCKEQFNWNPILSDAEKENQADSDVILRRTHSFESDEM